MEQLPTYRYFFQGFLKLLEKQRCGAGAGWSRGFLAGAGADLKFELELEPTFFVWALAPFLASEKRNKRCSIFFAKVLPFLGQNLSLLKLFY